MGAAELLLHTTWPRQDSPIPPHRSGMVSRSSRGGAAWRRARAEAPWAFDLEGARLELALDEAAGLGLEERHVVGEVEVHAGRVCQKLGDEEAHPHLQTRVLPKYSGTTCTIGSCTAVSLPARSRIRRRAESAG